MGALRLKLWKKYSESRNLPRALTYLELLYGFFLQRIRYEYQKMYIEFRGHIET